MPMDAQFECLVGTASLGKDKVLQEGPTSTLRYRSCYSGSSVTVELSIRPAAGAPLHPAAAAVTQPQCCGTCTTTCSTRGSQIRELT